MHDATGRVRPIYESGAIDAFDFRVSIDWEKSIVISKSIGIGVPVLIEIVNNSMVILAEVPCS